MSTQRTHPSSWNTELTSWEAFSCMQTALITTCLTVKISAGVPAEATKSPEFLRSTKWPTSLRDSVWLKWRLYTSSTSSVTFGRALSSSVISLLIDHWWSFAEETLWMCSCWQSRYTGLSSLSYSHWCRDKNTEASIFIVGELKWRASRLWNRRGGRTCRQFIGTPTFSFSLTLLPPLSCKDLFHGGHSGQGHCRKREKMSLTSCVCVGFICGNMVKMGIIKQGLMWPLTYDGQQTL